MKRIPFKPELALAIREGRKTETRRIITPQPDSYFDGEPFWNVGGYRLRASASNPIVPRYLPSEIVGVCEPWRLPFAFDDLSGAEALARFDDVASKVRFDADFTQPEDLVAYGRRRLARFLPDAFVRTRIRILDVSAARLQEITEKQAKAEGVEDVACCEHCPQPSRSYVRAFSELWDTIHGADKPWDSNPLVWRYQFALE